MLSDNEIRLKIAELKGWKFYEIDAGQCVCAHHPNGYNGIQYACRPGDYPDCAGYGLKVHEIEKLTRGDAWDEDAPNWPANISEAWELVEEMMAGGYFVKVMTPHMAGEQYTVKVDEMGWGDQNPPPPGGWHLADTAARAICLAWLKLKGVEV